MKKLIAGIVAILAATLVASEFAYIQLLDAQTRTMDAGAKLLILKSESDMRMLVLKVQIARAMGLKPGEPTVEKPSAKDGTPLQTL